MKGNRKVGEVGRKTTINNEKYNRTEGKKERIKDKKSKTPRRRAEPSVRQILEPCLLRLLTVLPSR